MKNALRFSVLAIISTLAFGASAPFAFATDATAPSAIDLTVGVTNPVGGVTNVVIPAAGGTNTTGAVTGWITSTADTVKFTVTDSSPATSTITINSAPYTSGADYTIAAASPLTIVVTTNENGNGPTVRTFTVSVSQAASNDASSIVLSGTPSGFTFGPTTYSYSSVTVPNSQTGITVTPTFSAGTATVNGEAVLSGGTSSSTALTIGVAATINVVITETGKSSKTYAIDVTRALPVLAGTPSLSGTPATYGTQMTALVGTVSPATNLTYTWYRSADNAVGGDTSLGTGTTYTPVTDDVGNYLIVVVTSTDATGSSNIVTDAIVAKAAAPAAPTSGVTFSVLDGTVTGLGTTYEYNNNDGSFGTTASGVTFVAGTVKVRIKETSNTLPSATETIGTVSATPSAPSAPALSSKTDTSITLTGVSGNQFRKDAGSWQDSNVFSGLTASTGYTFTARVKATVTANASGASSGTAITTEATNNPPAFDPIADQSVNINSSSQNISITNVADPESLSVSMLATSNDTSIIPNPLVTGVGSTRTLSYTPATDKTGTVTITVTANDGQSSNNTYSRTFTITVSIPAMTGTAAITGTATYGSTLTADISGLTNAGTPTYQWKRGDSAIDGATASTYILVSADIGSTIKVTVTAQTNVGTGSVTSNPTGIVAKADQAITFGTLSDKTYGAADFILSATASSSLTVAFASQTTGVCTATGTTVHIVSAGTCTVRASQVGDDNYNAASNVDRTFTINKATAVVTVTPYTVSYDGSPHTATVASIAGVNGETAATVGTVLLDTTHTVAGTYLSDQWSFTGAANYNNDGGTVNDAIAKADSTITIVGGTFTYDGSPHGATNSSVIGAGGLNTTASSSLTYFDVDNNELDGAPTNAGTYTVVASYAGDANHNGGNSDPDTIQLDQATSNTSITCPASVTYNGSAQTPCTVAVTGAGGLSLAPTPNYTSNTNAGTANAAYTYDGDVNHAGSGDSRDFTVAKANPTIIVTPYSVTYNGNPHTAVSSAKGVQNEDLAGLVVTDTTHTNAGDYASDAWTFTDVTGNYNNASSTVYDAIAQKSLIVSATGINKEYDTNANATVILTDDKVSGDDVADHYTSATFDNGNIGNDKAVSVTGISISGTKAGNYTFNTTADTTANIVDTTSLAPDSFVTGSATASSLALSWTNSELNGSYYTIKRSTTPITSENFSAATTLGGAPTVASGVQGYVVKNLSSGTGYYFAIKMTDVVGNISAISTANGTTTAAGAQSADTTAPSAVTDLSLSAGTIPTSQIVLHWSATGDDGSSGLATSYVIKRSTSAITSDNFDVATTIFNSISPSASSSAETLTVSGLTASTTYYFAIKVQDEVPNTSPISNVEHLTTSNALPTVTSVSPSTGQNDGAVSVTVTGTNFASGTNTIRFTNSSNTFDLAGTYASSTQVTVNVPIGEPSGVYGIRVIDDNGTSAVLASVYTITAASTPIPSVTDVVPSNIGNNDSNVNVEIYGTSFTGATVAVIDIGEGKILTNFTIVSATKITATIPGTLSAGTYNVKVTNANGTNTVSAVQITASAPVVIDSSTSQDQVTDKPVDMGNTSTIPVQVTMNSNINDSTLDNNTTIKVVIPPATAVTNADGSNYTGNINPPQLVKPTEEIAAKAGSDAVVITMGNPDQKINFSNDFVTTVTLETTKTTAPIIWYYNPSSGLEIAGKDGTKDGVVYAKGGTLLNTVINGATYTYTIGLLLDHMSSYVAGVTPTISGISPSSGVAGTSVIITGTNFSPGATAKFGSTSVSATVNNVTQIAVSAPSISEGSYTVTVTNTDALSATSPTNFTITVVPNGSISVFGGGGGAPNPLPGAIVTSTTPTVPITIITSNQGKVLGAATYNFTKDLKIGSKGADVTALQQFLLDNKFYMGPISGYFGSQTRSAVITFQKARGIAQVGNVGPLTRAELNKGIPSNESTVPGIAVYNFTKDLKIGSKGADVTALQQFLLDNKFYMGPISGYFGSQTRSAVITFQKARGIAQVGNVGPLTRAELNKGK